MKLALEREFFIDYGLKIGAETDSGLCTKTGSNAWLRTGETPKTQSSRYGNRYKKSVPGLGLCGCYWKTRWTMATHLVVVPWRRNRFCSSCFFDQDSPGETLYLAFLNWTLATLSMLFFLLRTMLTELMLTRVVWRCSGAAFSASSITCLGSMVQKILGVGCVMVDARRAGVLPGVMVSRRQERWRLCEYLY
jgi:hypothetical protein